MAAEQQIAWLRDALNLTSYYNTNDSARKEIEKSIYARNNAPGLNHQVMFYVSILASYSKQYGDYYRISLGSIKNPLDIIAAFFPYVYQSLD